MCVLLPTYYACGGDPTGHGYIGLEFRNGETCPLYPDCYNPVYRGWPIHDAPQFRQALCPECAPVRGQGRGDDLGEMAGNGSPGFAAPRFGVARGSPPGRIPPETAFHHYTWPGYGPPGARYDGHAAPAYADLPPGGSIFGGMRLPPCPWVGHGGHAAGRTDPPRCPFHQGGNGHPQHDRGHDAGGHQAGGHDYRREGPTREGQNRGAHNDGHEHCWHTRQRRAG